MSGEDQDKVIRIRPQQTDDKVVYESTTLPPWKRDYRGFSGTMGNREDSGKQAIDVINAGLDLVEQRAMSERRRSATRLGGRPIDDPEALRRYDLIYDICDDIAEEQLKHPDRRIEEYLYIVDMSKLVREHGYSPTEILEAIHYFMVKEEDPQVEPFHTGVIETYPTIISPELELEEIWEKNEKDEKFIVAHVVGKLSKERFRQQ